jgi:PmbA protein
MTDWIAEILLRAERCLTKAGVARWELAADETTHAAVEAMDGKVHVVERSFERTLGIRILERGIGFAGLTDPADDAAIEEAIEAAKAEAIRARPAAISDFAAASGGGAKRLGPDFFDERATGEVRAILEPFALELEAIALAAGKQIRRVRPARIEEQRGRTAIRTSAGADLEDAHTRAFASVGAVAEADDGEEAQSAFGMDSAPAIELLELTKIAHRAADDATRLLGAGSFRTARVPVIFGYDATAELIALLIGALEGDRIERSASFLAKALDTQAIHEALTIIDDPHDPSLDASAWFDGEALPTQKLALFDRGTMKHVLDDRDSAARAGRLPTAHAVRGSANAKPHPGVHNILVAPGRDVLDSLFRRAEGGLYVHELSGTHTMNEVTGELSLGATGWAIQGGAPAHAVEGATVAGTLLAMLSSPMSLSAETKRIGPFRVPAMLIEEVQVSAAVEHEDEAEEA